MQHDGLESSGARAGALSTPPGPVEMAPRTIPSETAEELAAGASPLTPLPGAAEELADSLFSLGDCDPEAASLFPGIQWLGGSDK